MAQNNQQGSNQFNDNFNPNQFHTTNYRQNLSQEQFQIEQRQRVSPSEFQQFGQNDQYSIAAVQQSDQFSNAAPLYTTGSIPHNQDQFLQSRFTPTQFPSFASSPSSVIPINNDNLITTEIQSGRDPFQSTYGDIVEPNEYATSADTTNFRSHSASISISEPTKSPVAMSPFMIPTGGASSSAASENNYGGESGSLSDSQVQMLLQQPLTISSVEVAAFHAREMSRSISGSTLLPVGSMQSQQQISFQPEQQAQQQQQQQQQQISSSNRNTFQFPAQSQIDYGANNQRTGSPFTGPPAGSMTGMPFAFANQTYNLAPSQEQSLHFQRNESRPGMNQSFARPQYPLGGGLSNYPRTSSNPISSSLSNSNPYRNITHRRVPAACNFCRMRKLRCDGNTPCRQCARRMIQCIYSEAAETRRQRRATVSTYPNSPNPSASSAMSMVQFSNETGRQSQEPSVPGLPGNIPSNQRHNWSANDQLTATRTGSSNQPMQSQQFQQINFAEQQYRLSRPQVPSNAEMVSQQDTNPQSIELNPESSSQIAGLPANWMPVSLHAPHRTTLPGGSSGSTQNTSQSNVQQKSSPFLISTNNDWSIPPPPGQQNPYQDLNQQSHQSYQSRKK